jgi:hypothetical protein
MTPEQLIAEREKEQEKRFIAWANSRDDDWWEDGQRFGIWDFRIMQEFFKEDYRLTLQQTREAVIAEVEFQAKQFNEKVNIYDMSSGAIDDDNKMLMGLIKDSRIFIKTITQLKGGV